jgi:BASS family bile acid:Na+ symporter
MMGMLAPVAVSATVVAVILGADMATMVTYTILYNVFLAFFAPFCFSLIGYHTGLSFWASCWIIIRKVVPLIILPLVSAVLCRRFLPRITAKIVNHKMISFYLWAAALTFVIGQTIDFIMMQDRSKTPIIIVMVAISLVQCIVQFAFGRWIGKKYDDTIAGGQAIGQKNGVLAAWMTQMYLNPLASVVPASYVLWQNLWNSWQLWRFKSPGPANKRVPMPNEEEKHSN